MAERIPTEIVNFPKEGGRKSEFPRFGRLLIGEEKQTTAIKTMQTYTTNKTQLKKLQGDLLPDLLGRDYTLDIMSGSIFVYKGDQNPSHFVAHIYKSPANGGGYKVILGNKFDKNTGKLTGKVNEKRFPNFIDAFKYLNSNIDEVE